MVAPKSKDGVPQATMRKREGVWKFSEAVRPAAGWVEIEKPREAGPVSLTRFESLHDCLIPPPKPWKRVSNEPEVIACDGKPVTLMLPIKGDEEHLER